ncbi:CHASE2 domain-containing protein [Comamonas guangdongensis]|uniref:histidine kinase n=1 Tax=Comamonas guangdongensis TaxID=510515 RepID=A0ABV3ZQX9_9BURK
MLEAATPRKREDQRYGWLLLAAFLLALVYWLSGPGQLARINGLIQDTSAWLHQRPASPDIVIVAVDDASIDTIGRWPWRRALHAAVLERIAQGQPLAIGMDIVFSEEDLDYPGDDLLLQHALRNSGKVVLPLALSAQGGVTLPLPSLRQASAALGHTQMPMDADGNVRRFYELEGSSQQLWWHMAVSLHCVGVTGRACSQAETAATMPSPSWQRLQPQVIALAKPAGNRAQRPASPFTTYAYIDVLRGNIPAAAFRGKYVLIGATAAGLGENISAPAGFDAHLVSNVEMLGHVLNGILLDTHLEPASPTLDRILNLVPVVLGLLALVWFGPSGGLLACAGLGIACLLVAGLAPRWSQVQTAPAAALLGLALAYPLWSWLRLRAATRFLALELRDLQGQGLPVSSAGSLRSDVLDRRIAAVEQASRQLRSLHHFVSESLRQLPSPTFVCDRDGKVLLANTAAHSYIQSLGRSLRHGDDLLLLLSGLSRVDDADRSGSNALTAGSAPLLDREAMLAARLPRQSEGRDAQGRFLMLLSQAFESQPTSGWLITLVDISDLRSAQAQRDQAMQFISHDIRAPIGSIITLLEMQRGPSAETAHEPLFARIEGYAQASLQLADDFVHLARAQQQSYRSEALDLGLLADQAVADCWAQARKQNVQLQFELPETEATVRGDPGLLHRAAVNLLSNAIKYGRPEAASAAACVECSLIDQDGCWGFAVRDHGPGMDQASLQRLSQPFERLQQHQRQDGVGLGLAFVRTVAQRHGGSLQIRSELGRGSLFILLIPKA